MCQSPPHWCPLCQSHVAVAVIQKAPGSTCPTPHQALPTKTTAGETTELRSHTEQFRSTNWSLIDPGADSSPRPPRRDRETPADALRPESLKMKDFHGTDLKQENMDYKHGANEE